MAGKEVKIRSEGKKKTSLIELSRIKDLLSQRGTVIQYVAVFGSALQYMCCSVLQCVAVNTALLIELSCIKDLLSQRGTVIQYVAVFGIVLQYMCCSVLQ